jgi:chromosome segregation ATPase
MSNKELPQTKSMIAYNRRLRSKIETLQKAFAETGEKIKAIKSELRDKQKVVREAQSRADSLEAKLGKANADAQKYKALYTTLVKDHQRLRRDSNVAYDNMQAEVAKRRKAEEAVKKIKKLLR